MYVRMLEDGYFLLWSDLDFRVPTVFVYQIRLLRKQGQTLFVKLVQWAWIKYLLFVALSSGQVDCQGLKLYTTARKLKTEVRNSLTTRI